MLPLVYAVICDIVMHNAVYMTISGHLHGAINNYCVHLVVF